MAERRRMMIACQAEEDPIPDGYERLKYIESSGHQGAIAQNVNPTWSRKKITSRFIAAYTNGNKSVGCARAYGAGQRMGFSVNKSILTVYAVDEINSISVELNADFHEILTDINSNVFVDGMKIGTTSTLTLGYAANKYLGLLCFASGNNVIYSYYTGKFKIYETYADEKLYSKIIPVINLETAKPYFYDVISETLYANKGSGEFGYEKLDGTYVAPI